jgi:DNA-binding HxlR family transcriptional regulator
LVGDRWSFLLIREVLFGTHRFDDFSSHLGISRNVLTQILMRLTDGGILMQKPLKQDAKRLGYYLTEKGEGLLPVLVALLHWGDEWLQSPDSVPMRVIERTTGQPLAPVRLHNREGHELSRRDLDWAPGPGALHPSVAHIAADYERQRWRAPLSVSSLVPTSSHKSESEPTS